MLRVFREYMNLSVFRFEPINSRLQRIAASPSRRVLSYALAAIAGVVCAALLPTSRAALPLAVGGLAACALAVRQRARPWERVLAIAVAFFLFGAARFTSVLPSAEVGHVLALDGRVVTLRGIVTTLPETRQGSVRVWITLDAHRDGRSLAPIRGVIQLFLPLSSPEQYGDRLEFSCRVSRLERPSASVSFFAREAGTASCASPKNVRILARGEGSGLLSAMFAARTEFRTAIDRVLPEPHASFLAGLLLGEQGAIPKDVAEAARVTGTTHMLAASGSNTGVIARWLFALLPLLLIRRTRALWVVGAFLAGFVVLSGASASVVRAAVMAAVGLLAALLGRPSRAFSALALAAAFIVFANPLAVWDVGFQLSVAATVGLIVIAPLLDASPRLARLPEALKRPLHDTLAATVATLPVIIWHFGRVSIVSPFANVLLVPLVPLGMGVGFVAASIGLIAAPLGTMAGFGAWLVLSGMLGLMQIFAAIPGASVQLVAPHLFALASAVALAAWFMRRARQRPAHAEEFNVSGYTVVDETVAGP